MIKRIKNAYADPSYNPKSFPPRQVPPLVLIPSGTIKIDGRMCQAYRIERATTLDAS